MGVPYLVHNSVIAYLMLDTIIRRRLQEVTLL